MGKKLKLPQTEEYPQLQEIADPTRLARAAAAQMGSRFASGELVLEKCKIKRLYYKPGPEGNCRIQLRARIRERGRLAEQIFLAQLWPEAVLEERFARAQGRRLAEPEYGRPVALIREWNMILWAYPNDPRLLGLQDLATPAAVLELMQRAPADYGIPPGQQPVGIEAQPTKYVPSQRCGSIFRVKLDPAGDGSEHVVYGKAYRSRAGRRAYEIARMVWDSEPRRRGELLLPQPFSFDAERNILWQEALPGQPLAKTSTGSDLPGISAEVGRRLAAFHGAQLDLPLRRTLAAQLEDQADSAASVARSFPDHAARIGALHQRLIQRASCLGPELCTPVHGSFKFSHVFLSRGRVAFIDFDGATLGDPGYDLGRFIAHVFEMNASRKLPDAIAKASAEQLIEGYAAAAAAPVPRARILWFASSLILSSQVYKAVKRFDPELVPTLLALAERTCPEL